MSKAKLRISRPSYSDGRQVISIEVTCALSLSSILELEVDLADFMKILTGQEMGCEMPYIIDSDNFPYIGKKGVRNTVLLDKPEHWGYKPTREQVIEELEKLGLLEEWELWQDGSYTQQNTKGKHKVILCKYVNEEI